MNFKALFTSMILPTTLLAQSAAERPKINAPLTAEQKAFVKSNAPIFIAPDFVERRDNLILFDLGTRMKDENDQPLGTIDPGQNAKAYLSLTKDTVGEVDWDFIEIGGAISLNFLFARPANLPTPRNIDAESAVILFKRSSFVPSSELHGSNLNEPASLVISNAHGAAMAAACNPSFTSCLPPAAWAEQSFGWGLKLQPWMQEQAKGANDAGRIVDLLDSRIVLVSEPGTHALSPVTNLTKLLEKIDIKKAVVYLPEGLDSAESQKRLSGAKFVTYKLRDKELSEVLIPNKDQIVAGPSVMSPATIFEGWYPDQKVQLVPNVGSEFRNAQGKESGANGYWGWGVVECVKDGARYEPKTFKDGPRASHVVSLSNLCSESLFGFFTKDEIDRGALKPIRNGWMQEVPAPTSSK